MTDGYIVLADADESVLWRDSMTLDDARAKAVTRANAERRVIRVVRVVAVEYAEPRDAELLLQPVEESRP